MILLHCYFVLQLQPQLQLYFTRLLVTIDWPACILDLLKRHCKGAEGGRNVDLIGVS